MEIKVKANKALNLLQYDHVQFTKATHGLHFRIAWLAVTNSKAEEYNVSQIQVK